MTDQQAVEQLLLLMQRVTLTGAEVPAYMELVKWLQSAVNRLATGGDHEQ